MELDASDERPHAPPPGASRDWEESWHFDFAVPDGSLGGFARLTLRPIDRLAWWWTCLVGRRRRLVTVRDHDVPLPAGRALEIRTSGLWAEITVEAPFEHWSVGLEAFAVALDDPAEAWATERGDPVALGLDLEWEEHAPVRPLGEGYAQPCVVNGEVLVGEERLSLSAYGWRTHEWGERRWWDATTVAPQRVAAHSSEGVPLWSDGSDPRFVETAPIARAPVLVTGARREVSRLDLALCHAVAAGRAEATGWCDRGVVPP